MRWTKEDCEIIKKAAEIMSVEEISLLLNRPISAIRKKASRLKVSLQQKRDFTICSNPDCKNPENGNLTIDDFYVNRNGMMRRCKQCQSKAVMSYYKPKKRVYKKPPDLDLAKQFLSRSLMRDYSECNKKENCLHPRQGLLTEKDYYVRKDVKDGKRYECKLCTKEMQSKKKKPRNLQMCSQGSDCLHPNKGNLIAQDFYPGRRVCIVCYKMKKKAVRPQTSRSENRKTVDQIINSSLVQQWLCGRVGYAVHK